MSERTEKQISIGLFLIGAGCFCIFWLSGCKSHVGCTKRDERKSARKFYKGLNTCQAEIARQSLLAFPFKETDSVVSVRIVPGDTISMPPDTVTIIHNDTVFRTVSRDRYRTDKIFIDKIRREEDQRETLIRNIEMNRLAELNEKQGKYISVIETKLSVTKKVGWYKTMAICGLILIILSWVGIKYGMAKYKALKAAKAIL